ncbi:MAG: proton-conducting transporter transmembrane domain-containing protein, partial [Planctomycetota bacterium]
AYSTVSQLGYMFMGIGLLTTVGAAYHVFTHAFFKAVLFLTAGAVMHGMAGQIDLRKVSGLVRLPGWGITSWTMLYACMCLAGVPFVTSGFFSKDALMAQAFISEGPGYRALGIIAIVTAFLTAYYAFRVWFRVCAGPVHHEPGDEHHGEPGGAFHPHAPRIAINLVLVVITAGGIWSIFLKDWAHGMVADSSASPGIPHDHHVEGGLWADPHKWMPLVAGSVGIAGIAIAWYFHLANRAAADRLRSALLGNPVTRWLPVAMERKWFVDELYHFFIRAPLWRFGWVLDLFDRVVVDFSIIDGIAKLPRALGRGFQPLANGILQSYAISMAGGVALVALLVFYLPQLLDLFTGWLNGGAS